MKRFVVSEETKELVGMELIEDINSDELIVLRDIDEIDGKPTEYFILRKDIPKLIEGLKLFIEE